MPTKPEVPGAAAERTETPVLEVRDLDVHYQLQGSALGRLFGAGSQVVRAVDGVNLQIRRGEVLGLVGESGSGKTTLGRALLGLAPASNGSIAYHHRQRGERLVSQMKGKELRALRTDLQMVFQDPAAALNPSMTIGAAIGDPLRVHGIARGEELRRRVVEALERVGLSPAGEFLGRFPRDLSGGQKQRAVIARAIILDPEVLVADEPISMLDMSIRAKILQLMLDLKRDLGLTYLYITHDLASAKYFCDRIAIMYLGRVVEIGPTEEIFDHPRHPYTKALLKAIPEPDPSRSVARDLPRGEIPDAARPPLGCAFHPRCPEAVAECGWESRDLRTLIEQHWTRGGLDFAEERAVVGDLGHLDEPATDVVLRSSDPQETLDLLQRIRDEDPDEPLWNGVDALEEQDGGVRVRFHPGVDPALRPAGGVEVACVLYGEEAGPAAD